MKKSILFGRRGRDHEQEDEDETHELIIMRGEAKVEESSKGDQCENSDSEMFFNSNENAAAAAASNTCKRTLQGASALLKLPNDALHSIASFVMPTDWRSLSVTSKAIHKATRPVFKRVRMHGYECAINVVTAFALNELSDARELAALYCTNGVPIYPSPGSQFTFPTLVWRMNCEQHTPPPSSIPNNNDNNIRDRFYGERYEARIENGYYQTRLTYLEEKALFWKMHRSDQQNQQPLEEQESNGLSRIQVHRHLYDEHAKGSFTADDDDFNTAAVSFSADFFFQIPEVATPNRLDRIFMMEDESEHHQALSSVSFDVYSAASVDDECLRIFELYRKKLNRLFDTGDEYGFDECLADFWDIFFKVTAGISYFDRHTAVPRISKLKDFLTNPCPKGVGVVQCDIERIKNTEKNASVKGRLFPVYDYRVFIRGRGSSKDIVLMTAKNIGRQASKRGVNNYIISMADRPVALGRLQSNFIGTEFQIFNTVSKERRSLPVPRPLAQARIVSEHNHHAEINDCVSGSKKKWSITSRSHSRRAIANDESASNNSSQSFESEDGIITYTANLLGNRPRIMDVCIPKEKGDEEWKKSHEGELRMLHCFKILQERLSSNILPDPSEEDENEDQTDFGLICLQNRPPWWNVELGAFVLNFGGRVSVASVKNFQLCHREDQDNIMLQFGRIHGKHSFTMDFQYPLTAVQAFAISISSLQSKISLG